VLLLMLTLHFTEPQQVVRERSTLPRFVHEKSFESALCVETEGLEKLRQVEYYDVWIRVLKRFQSQPVQLILLVVLEAQVLDQAEVVVDFPERTLFQQVLFLAFAQHCANVYVQSLR